MADFQSQPALAGMPRASKSGSNLLSNVLRNVVEDLTPQLGGDLIPGANFIGRTKGSDIASATPTVTTSGDYFDVTGTTTITAWTVAANRHFFTQFDGAVQLTHNGTNLDLPGEANITTAAGDVFEWFSTGANTAQCIGYVLASGKAVIETASAATKEFFVMVASSSGGTSKGYDNLIGDFPNSIMNSTDDCAFVFFIPADFSSLTSAVLIMIPDATETVNWSITTDFGANGEARNANSDSETSSASATADEILEIDISATLTGLAANDYVGLLFNSDTASIRAIGIRIKYS